MTRTTGYEAHALLARGQDPGSTAITEEQLAGLPDPVRRHLHDARVVGKAPIRMARL